MGVVHIKKCFVDRCREGGRSQGTKKKAKKGAVGVVAIQLEFLIRRGRCSSQPTAARLGFNGAFL